MKMGALQSLSQETSTLNVPRTDNTTEDLRKGPNGIGLVENSIVMLPCWDIKNSHLNLDKNDSISDDRVVGLKRKRLPSEVESFQCLPALDYAPGRNDMSNKKSKVGQSTEVSFDNMTGEAILKLLELDDPDDEERFNMAMDMPLSPTLAEIEMPSIDAFEVEEGICNVRTNEIDSNEMMEMAEQPLGHVSKCFVAFPNIKDKTSISRIISGCETCMSSSSIISPKVWMVKEVLVAVAEREDLQAEEKACVFFSCLLHNFLDIMPPKLTSVFADDIHSCWNSFLTHMKSVMSNAEWRNKLLKLFHLDTLLSLIESFILQKRVVSVISLSSEQATTDTLVAASFILASICATTGRTGFVCEASYKLLRMCRADSCLTVTMVHAFALVCGSTYLNLRSHSLAMAVIRCVVSFLERDIGSESLPRFHQCDECVFLKGVELSVDDVSSLLIEKLQECVVVKRTGNHPRSDVSDVISLVELLAYYMGWEWTSRNIIPHLLKIADSCIEEEALAAIIILIGQLGRFGIADSGGNEPLGVEELRCYLNTFLNQTSTRNFGLPTQFAIIHSLTSLISEKLEELVKYEGNNCQQQHLLHANLVKAWFSQLNEDHKSLSLRLLV